MLLHVTKIMIWGGLEVDVIAFMHGTQIIGCTTPLKYYGVREVRRVNNVIKPLYHLALSRVFYPICCVSPIVLPLGCAWSLFCGVIFRLDSTAHNSSYCLRYIRVEWGRRHCLNLLH